MVVHHISGALISVIQHIIVLVIVKFFYDIGLFQDLFAVIRQCFKEINKSKNGWIARRLTLQGSLIMRRSSKLEVIWEED
mmetsp:Transcript_9969/g.21074  ORF Transcript_9969/g.21074 Transcript_9969/m.21074 type:complete len:80 (+) Transcript_9969:216-455(+)